MRRSWLDRAGQLAGVALLLLLLWPLAYSVWLSFTPSNYLEPPPPSRWSLRWYGAFFADRRWVRALWVSLVAGGAAAALSLAAGLGVGLAVVRHRFRGRRVLEAAIVAPLFLPAVVLGMALLPVSRWSGLWGSCWPVAAAHALWGAPLVFLVVRGALEELDPDLVRAARGLGASPWQVFLRVELPLLAPALVLGAALAFVVSFNEVVMALFLGTAPDAETLPKVIWPSLRYTLTPLVAAASSISLLVTVVLLAVCWAAWAVGRWLRGR